MPFVSITRLRVRSWRYLPGFLLQSVRAARQAKGAPGNLSVSLLRDVELAFWTRTVWSDETAMRGFMLSGTHRRVMPRLLQWCDEAALVHWTQEFLGAALLGGGAPAPAAGRAAFQGQPSLAGATAVRVSRAAQQGRGADQMSDG